MFITINKQAVKLYWVTTADHDEDWFIFAESDRSARAYHEHNKGYGKGDAHSRLIVSNVTLKGSRTELLPAMRSSRTYSRSASRMQARSRTDAG